jgi:hypothetical protein
MATVTRELPQVCTPCTMLIANGEAWENHEDVSERTAERQVATLGADAGWLVLVGCQGEDPACKAGECDDEPHISIGKCDACGEEPDTGYWHAHAAAVIR